MRDVCKCVCVVFGEVPRRDAARHLSNGSHGLLWWWILRYHFVSACFPSKCHSFVMFADSCHCRLTNGWRLVLLLFA